MTAIKCYIYSLDAEQRWPQINKLASKDAIEKWNNLFDDDNPNRYHSIIVD